jgi:hypothetical protein
LFHIIGCNHGIQLGTGGFAVFDGAEANEQREHFRRLLSGICAENGIEILLEEDGTIERTSAQEIATDRGIAWENINTTNQDKDQLGIPRDYLTGPYSDEQKDQWTRQRELFMVARIVAHSESIKNAMVICGFEHLEPIFAQLEAQGITVRMLDYRASSWYRLGVFDEGP